MMWKYTTLVLAGLFAVFGVVGAQCVSAQVFPYSAPKAPEFDADGNVVQQRPDDDAASRPGQVAGSDQNGQAPVKPAVAPTRYGVPVAPEVIPRRPPSERKRVRRRHTESRPVVTQQPAAPPPNYSQQYGVPPPPPPSEGFPAPNQRKLVPDCSNYPMMIAQAPSKPEMQSIARHFLTCLLQSGWPMDRARKHVISTIETVKAMRF